MLFAALLGLAVVSANPAEAAYDKCTNVENATSMTFLACGNKWVAQEEADLSAAWQKTYGALETPQAKAKLLEEQRNWVTYKDSSCKFLGTDEFGSNGWSLEAPRCRALVIQNRIEQLKAYASPSDY